ncbi:hypothetical protein GCM10009642_12030 [Nocardiopsis metallicus]
MLLEDRRATEQPVPFPRVRASALRVHQAPATVSTLLSISSATVRQTRFIPGMAYPGLADPTASEIPCSAGPARCERRPASVNVTPEPERGAATAPRSCGRRPKRAARTAP